MYQKCTAVDHKPNAMGMGEEWDQGQEGGADLSLQYFLGHSEDYLDRDGGDDSADDVDDNDSD